MEEALHDIPLYREFAQLGNGMTRLPDESTILRFRHLLEAHKLAAQMFAAVNEFLQAEGLTLKAGSAIDATLIQVPNSTKKPGTRDPEMRSTQKGGSWYFGMKAHLAWMHSRAWCTRWYARQRTFTMSPWHGRYSMVEKESGFVCRCRLSGARKAGRNRHGSLSCRDASGQAHKTGQGRSR
jgi:IS5 family transposase